MLYFVVFLLSITLLDFNPINIFLPPKSQAGAGGGGGFNNPRLFLIENSYKHEIWYSIGSIEKSYITWVNYRIIMLTSAENRLFYKMAVTFDLNKIFQFCLDILKDK